MNAFENAGGKFRKKLAKFAPHPPIPKKVKEKIEQKKEEKKKGIDPAITASLAALRKSKPKASANKLNDLIYKHLHAVWVKNTNKQQPFDTWMSEAHQVYGSKARNIGFDQWLASAVEQKVMSAEGETVTDVKPPSTPKTYLGMSKKIAVPVFIGAGLLLIWGCVKVFKKG